MGDVVREAESAGRSRWLSMCTGESVSAERITASAKAGASEAVDELLDEERAFAHGLFAEGAEPLGDLAEAGDELRFVAALDEVEVLLEGLDVVLQQGLGARAWRRRFRRRARGPGQRDGRPWPVRGGRSGWRARACGEWGRRGSAGTGRR